MTFNYRTINTTLPWAFLKEQYLIINGWTLASEGIGTKTFEKSTMYYKL